jgi:hypothetical protein
MPSRVIYIGDELLQTFKDGTGVITLPRRQKISAA